MTIRNVIVTILLAISFVSTQAQQVAQGTLGSLQDVRVASVRYDFSHAMVGNESLDDYIQLMVFKNGDKYVDEFENEMKGVIIDFIDEYNDTNCPVVLTVSDKPVVDMLISIENISRNGNTITANYIYTNKESGNVLVAIQMTAKDGRCGSFTNLMGDAFEEAGKKLGKYIKKNLKQKKTKN